MAHFDLDFPRACGAPRIEGVLRNSPEDFVVEEIPGWDATGHGEHLLLHVQKRGANTGWVAEQLAGLAGIKVNDVGYCGLKDRHALTQQYFSLYLPKSEPDWQGWRIDGVQILSARRHAQKLRRGMHAANRFVLRLHQVDGDWEELERRLQTVAVQGVPNYFGEQRFGRQGHNLDRAEALFAQPPSRERPAPKSKKRKAGGKYRNLYLSAARSWIFNLVLAERVRRQCWRQALPGEDRPQGPLWGRGRPLAEGESLALQSAVLEPWQHWLNGLEHAGLSQELRPLCLVPQQLTWELVPHQGDVELRFVLPVGAYATAILRELLWYYSPSVNADSSRE